MYYPKSKILENQYTSGGQFIDPSTGNTYIGFYHVTYDGNVYTGANHSISSRPLSGTPSSTGSLDSLVRPGYVINVDYDNISQNKMSYLFNFELPTPIYPIPSANDYQNGQFNRFFMQLVTNMKITEISQVGYQVIQSNPLYNSLTIIWKLTGPIHDISGISGIADTNARTLAANEKKMKGISGYLTNPIELAKII